MLNVRSLAACIVFLAAACSSPRSLTIANTSDAGSGEGSDGEIAKDAGIDGRADTRSETDAPSLTTDAAAELDAMGSVDRPFGTDTAMGGTDMAACSPNDRSCCKGCWDGTSCRAGTDIAACGTGGESCKPCND